MSRFEVADEVVEVPRKTKQKDQVPPPAGPSSSNPGRWLTEMYAELTEASSTGEGYETVTSILESYRPGLRYRTLKVPVRGQGWEFERPVSDFIVLDTDLETKAFCYGTADVSAMREVDSAPSFTMMGQDWCFVGCRSSVVPGKQEAGCGTLRPEAESETYQTAEEGSCPEADLPACGVECTSEPVWRLVRCSHRRTPERVLGRRLMSTFLPVSPSTVLVTVPNSGTVNAPRNWCRTSSWCCSKV